MNLQLVGVTFRNLYQVVLADGSIAWVDKDKTSIFYPTEKTVEHTETNNLFFALRGAGSSFAVVTEFLYMIYETYCYLFACLFLISIFTLKG